MSNKTIYKIAFVDGGEAFEKIIKQLLSERFDVVSTFDNPDLCVFNFSNGKHHPYFNCKKLEISGENAYPHFDQADYSITCHRINFSNRHCRIPFFVFNKEYAYLINTEHSYAEQLFDREFCSAVISNGFNADPFRLKLLIEINSRKHINSIGSLMNNTHCILESRPINAENGDGMFTNPAKIRYIKNFKFNIALENSSVDGYVTEKITDAFAANTIPIYWGDETVYDEFYAESFIKLSKNDSFDVSFSKIMEVCENKDKYMAMLRSPKIKNELYLETLRDFLYNVVDGKCFEHRYGNIGI